MAYREFEKLYIYIEPEHRYLSEWTCIIFGLAVFSPRLGFYAVSISVGRRSTVTLGITEMQRVPGRSGLYYRRKLPGMGGWPNIEKRV